MFEFIYIENSVANHPRTHEICAKYPDATKIPCNYYGEVFNRKSQNFRLQKQNPALILAAKHENHVLKTPDGYGIGGQRNFYFSHMLNCLYDCRYCFLQGMYHSAHYVLFVNYEDFLGAISRKLAATHKVPSWFFSGYDCDSLALEPVSGFIKFVLPWFEQHPRAMLEIRTKSTQIRSLLNSQPLDNVIVACSFTPDEINKALEHKVPGILKRLDSMAALQASGWKIGLRFDPIIYHQNYRSQYQELFRETFARLDRKNIHSVSLGPFRLPRSYFKKVSRLYPEEPLFAGPLVNCNGMVSYPGEVEQEIIEFCTNELLRYVPGDILYPCRIAA